MTTFRISDQQKKLFGAAMVVGGGAYLLHRLVRNRLPAIPAEKVGAICTRPPTPTLSLKSDSWQELTHWSPPEASGGTVALWNLNAERLALANEKGRSVIAQSNIEAFLNPNVPMESIFQRGVHLGSGAFGSVDVWTDPTGHSYAIKEMAARFGQLPGDQDFLIGMQLDHPNIMQVHNLVTKIDPLDGRPTNYLIMELVDGRPLYDASLTDIRRLSLLQQMSESIEHMLTQGIVPGDLHRNNIMVTWDGTLKLIDLGLYKPLNGSAKVGSATVEIAGALNAIAAPLGTSDATQYSNLISMLQKTLYLGFTEHDKYIPLTTNTAQPLLLFLQEVYREATELRSTIG